MSKITEKEVNKQFEDVIDSYNQLADDFFKYMEESPIKTELLRLLKNSFQIKVEKLVVTTASNTVDTMIKFC